MDECLHVYWRVRVHLARLSCGNEWSTLRNCVCYPKAGGDKRGFDVGRDSAGWDVGG